MERELSGNIGDKSEISSDEVLSTKSHRKRKKKKSYGIEFEEDSISETEENVGMLCLHVHCAL